MGWLVDKVVNDILSEHARLNEPRKATEEDRLACRGCGCSCQCGNVMQNIEGVCNDCLDCLEDAEED